MRSTFTKPIFTGVVSLVVFSVANPSWAVSVESVPNSRQLNGSWVSDQANLLSPETEAELNRLISQLVRKNGNEIAVVTVLDTAPSASPKQFATNLFNRWGIGKKGANNGVLFLISKSDRRVEIETGDGLQAILPDAKVSNIIQQQITPRFKQQNFNGGVLVGTKALIKELNPDRSLTAVSVPVVTHTVQNESGGNDWLMGVGAAALLISGTVGVIKFVRPPKLVAPEGRTRIFGAPKSDRCSYHCAKCKHQMKKLDDAAIFSILREPKRVAQQLGSVKFEGWQCSRCHPSLNDKGVHIFTYVLDSQNFRKCSHCQEFTVSAKPQILASPTWSEAGKQLVELTCHCCDYQEAMEELIPKLVPPIGTVFLQPEGRSRVENYGFNRASSTGAENHVHCAQCNWPMKLVNATILQQYLSPPEQIAQNLGSVKFIGWQCPQCLPLLGYQALHLRAYVIPSPRYKICHHCQEITLEFSDRILQAATQHCTGTELITEHCHCCGYRAEEEIIIPCLPPPTPSSSCSNDSSSSYSSDSSSSYSSHSSSSYSSDSSSTSSSSSDFGGGSSGGGGAGGDW